LIQTRYIEHHRYSRLLDHLSGDAASQRRFVLDFVSLWTPRTERLQQALATNNLQDADVVLLSIRSSSTMIGAMMLEAAAGLIHSAVKRRDVAGAEKHLARLHELGGLTCAELLWILEHPEPAGTSAY